MGELFNSNVSYFVPNILAVSVNFDLGRYNPCNMIFSLVHMKNLAALLAPFVQVTQCVKPRHSPPCRSKLDENTFTLKIHTMAYGVGRRLYSLQ